MDWRWREYAILKNVCRCAWYVWTHCNRCFHTFPRAPTNPILFFKILFLNGMFIISRSNAYSIPHVLSSAPLKHVFQLFYIPIVCSWSWGAPLMVHPINLQNECVDWCKLNHLNAPHGFFFLNWKNMQFKPNFSFWSIENVNEEVMDNLPSLL